MVSEWFLNDILDSLYRLVVLNGVFNYRNGPIVLNGTEWYSVVISGIPLDLFCKGC